MFVNAMPMVSISRFIALTDSRQLAQILASRTKQQTQIHIQPPCKETRLPKSELSKFFHLKNSALHFGQWY